MMIAAVSGPMAAFNEPRLAINRVYTKRGDTGETSRRQPTA